MKLKFKMLDERGTVFQARVASPGDEAAHAAFAQWCSQWLPPAGEEWSCLETADAAAQPGQPAGRTVIVVFGNDALARRFRTGWY